MDADTTPHRLTPPSRPSLVHSARTSHYDRVYSARLNTRKRPVLLQLDQPRNTEAANELLVVAPPGAGTAVFLDALLARAATADPPCVHSTSTDPLPHRVLRSTGGPETGAIVRVAETLPAAWARQAMAGEAALWVFDEDLVTAGLALERRGLPFEAAVRAVLHAKATAYTAMANWPEDIRPPTLFEFRSTDDGGRAATAVGKALVRGFDTPGPSSCAAPAGKAAGLGADAGEPARPAGDNVAHTDRLLGSWSLPQGPRFRLGPSFFVLGDDPHSPAVNEVDATGPARILIGGGYVFLPAAAIACDLRLRLSDELDGEPMRVSVYSGTDLAFSADFTAASGDPIDLRFSFPNPAADVPLDLHVLSLSGCIDGFIRLDGASFALA